jgi:hypothetical protein
MAVTHGHWNARDSKCARLTRDIENDCRKVVAERPHGGAENAGDRAKRDTSHTWMIVSILKGGIDEKNAVFRSHAEREAQALLLEESLALRAQKIWSEIGFPPELKSKKNRYRHRSGN